MPELTPGEWDTFLASHTNAHILQTRAWGELKTAFGWKVYYLAAQIPNSDGRIGAQILFKKLPLGLSMAYMAKGPIGCGSDVEFSSISALLLPELDQLCRRERAVFLKVEPDLWETDREMENLHAADPAPDGFRNSPQTIQPRRTLVVDLQGDEEQVLSRMKQKTRYNIRLAQKKGVAVHSSADMETFHHLMLLTSERDTFGVHSLEYYQQAFDLFSPRDGCVMLMAEFEGQPLAALMAFRRGERAWYFYGASANEHRERMPTYLLQWEAMRWARLQGCTSYDLWGVPDAEEPDLEADFANRSDGLWGVYRFKRGFGGQLRRASGPWDRVYNPLLYSFYRLWMSSRSRKPG